MRRRRGQRSCCRLQLRCGGSLPAAFPFCVKVCVAFAGAPRAAPAPRCAHPPCACAPAAQEKAFDAAAAEVHAAFALLEEHGLEVSPEDRCALCRLHAAVQSERSLSFWAPARQPRALAVSRAWQESPARCEAGTSATLTARLRTGARTGCCTRVWTTCAPRCALLWTRPLRRAAMTRRRRTGRHARASGWQDAAPFVHRPLSRSL